MQKILKCFFVLVCVLLIFILAAPATTLPNGYTQLEYIDIDSTYIDTGLYLYTDQSTNHYPNIHFTFMPLRYRTDSDMTSYLGGRDSSLGGGNGVMFGSVKPSKSNFSYIDYFDGTRYHANSGTGVQLNTKYKYDIVNKSATLKDITNNTTLFTYTFNDSTQSSNNSLTINNLHSSETISTVYNNKLRIYNFSVEGESNLIPAKRKSDNAVGLYDTIRNIFILPDSGIATAGPEVSYTQLEYIESTGTQYIDTGISYQSTDLFELDFMVTDLSSSKHVLSNNRVDQTDAFFQIAQTSTLLLADINNDGNGIGRVSTDQITSLNNRIKVYIPDGQTVYMNNTFIGTAPNPLNTNSNTLRLFGSYITPESNIRIYSLKIGNKANLIPVKRKSDNVVGLYDLVGDTFYTNSGTGDFIAGPEVCATTVTILGAQFCLTENQPSGSYLTARYNNNKYYINLSVENDALNPKTITSESNNVLKIKVGNTTYNAHDSSVSQ